MKSSQALAKKTVQEVATALPVKPFEQLFPATVSRDLARITDLSAALAVADKMPAVALLKKTYGEDKILLLVKAFLLDLDDFFDFDKKMNDAQMDFIANEVLSRYYAVTIADIHVIFRNAKSGAYGEFYGRVAPDRVLRWFADYWGERCETAALLSQNSNTGERGGNITSAMAAKQLGKLEEKFGFREHFG